MQLLSPVSFTIDAFRVRLALSLFDGGWTVVRLPPVGQIEAHTHLGPVEVSLALQDIDPELLRQMIDQGTRETVLPRVERLLERDAALFAGWVLLLAFAGGGLAAWVFGPRERRLALGGATAGVAAVGSLLLLTLGTYRVQAFNQPRFVGALQAAPHLIALTDETFRQARQFQQQLGGIAGGLYQLFGGIERLQGLGPEQGQPTVLLVSDIHNNPLGFDLVQRMVETFHPAFVLDAGDLTDWGTPIESSQLRRLADLHLPYVITAGNHESPQEIADLRRLPNVVLLDGQEVVEDGVPVIGIADPSSRGGYPQVAPPAQLAAASQRLAADVAAAPEPPAIIMAHNPAVVEPLLGMAPVVINGHTHSIWVRQERGSVWLNDGTTGAAGVRGLTTERGVPYSLMALYLARARGQIYLRAVDTVRLEAATGILDVQRQAFPAR